MPSSNEIDVGFKFDTKTSLSSSPAVPGQIQAVLDVNDLYVTDPSGNRVKITDVINLNTEAERRALLAPKNKFYFCQDSNVLWYYSGKWRPVGQEDTIKTIKIPIATSNVTTNVILESQWTIKRITFIPSVAYSENAYIEVLVGSEVVLSRDDLNPSSITDQYDNFKVITVGAGGNIGINITNAQSGSGSFYVEYMMG